MDKFKETLLYLSSDDIKIESLVSLLVLIESRLEINTISATARNENKTPRGIRISNQYRKLHIGKQLFAVIGLKDDNMPF